MEEENLMAGLSEWALKNVVQDVGDPMDALCTNKAFDLLAVAGKSVMKVYSLKNNEFQQMLDLRSKSRRMLYFSGSVSWSPVNESLIAATSSTGTIVLFNIEENSAHASPRFIDPEGPSAVDQFFRANKPAATKVCFHSYDPDLFVSGSKDATIYLYDLRHDKLAASYGLKGAAVDSIRDLQFCLDPSHQNYFVTGGDSGIVRFWDLRQPDRYLKEFIGNTSSAAIALNPNAEQWNLLATVGRDGFMRVWDWSERPKILYSIESPTAINRVEWVPSLPSHVATTTLNHDHQLLIWSHDRPYFPIMTFRGHNSSNISDMAFPQHSEERKFVTCGKDRQLILHFIDYGDETMENMHPVSMAGSHNEIATSFPKEYFNDNTVAEFDYSRPIEPALVQHSNGTILDFNNSNNLIKLAKAYKFEGDNPVRICNYNAHVNKKLGNFSLAYTWKLIGILIQQADIYKPPPPDLTNDAYFEYVGPNKCRSERAEKLEDETEVSQANNEYNVETGTFCHSFEQILSLESDLFFHVNEFNMSGLPGSARFLEYFQQKQENLANPGLEFIKEEAVTADSMDDESETDSEMGRSNLSDQVFSAEEQDSSSSSGGERSSPALLSPCGSILESASEGSLSSDVDNWVDDEKIEKYFSVGMNSESDTCWGPLTMLKQLINVYSEIGDSQTCATVCLILGKLANQMFGDDQISAWFFHYIDMLQDAGSNELATFINKKCTCEEVRRTIQENMYVKFFCANCSTAAPSSVFW